MQFRKKSLALLLTIIHSSTLVSMGLDDNNGGSTVRLNVDLPKQFPAFTIDLPRHPLKVEINTGISSNALFSCLGLFISVLGSILLYKGIEKTAHGNCTQAPNNELVKEGSSLNKYGLVLIACGLLAVWHKKIHETISPH